MLAGGIVVIVRSCCSSHADVEQRRRVGRGSRYGCGPVGGELAVVGPAEVVARRTRFRRAVARVLARTHAAVGDRQVTGAHTFRAEAVAQVAQRAAQGLRGVVVLGVDRRVEHAVAHLDAHLDAAELGRLQLEAQGVGAVLVRAQRREHRHELFRRRRRDARRGAVLGGDARHRGGWRRGGGGRGGRPGAGGGGGGGGGGGARGRGGGGAGG